MEKSTKEEPLWNFETETTRYYISTTAILNAQDFNEIIRNHWNIENSNHGVRDNTLEEDKSRIRKNPEAMARIRSLVLNILAFKKETQNLPRIIERNAWSQDISKFYAGVF
jgi:predicted transposase YbfD/YdcC